jgi:hypothetical protein
MSVSWQGSYRGLTTIRFTSASSRVLESDVCDLDRWAELANNLVSECRSDEKSWRELELAGLVVGASIGVGSRLPLDLLKVMGREP